ncbi:MAG: hypothetical protein BGO21_08670 [Dyadobacter sp. 50-39]|uniref:hypothetical protein n=1 Tax=Dyadobacter sp. 50-39 TaxID=1895756 RepID=UPI00095B6F2C|nr:hypothetical protein [Dyadobacter sp. 50-39]OJV20958.1 MAG: hypothetical protein BGO21_08670 [Dyadobacter sp. 50-39]
MKALSKIHGILSALALGGLLAACQNDQIVSPIEKSSDAISNQNARGVTLTRLVKQDNNSIQYNKSGLYFGKISKLEKADTYTEYTYGDIFQSTKKLISAKQFNKATKQLVSQYDFQVENGRCTGSYNSKNGHSYQYKYNASGLLEEVLDSHPSYLNGWNKAKFTYAYNASTNSYRLTRIDKSDAAGPLDEKIFTYTSQPNNDFPNLDYIGYEVEPYLPIFGTFSDVLIGSVEYNHFASGIKLYDKYDYVLDSNGNVSSRSREFHPQGKANASMSMSSVTFQFSQNWQGI